MKCSTKGAALRKEPHSNQLQAKQNILKKLSLIHRCLDLPAIAYTLERECKYEVMRWNKKTQFAEIRVILFLEVGRS